MTCSSFFSLFLFVIIADAFQSKYNEALTTGRSLWQIAKMISNTEETTKGHITTSLGTETHTATSQTSPLINPQTTTRESPPALHKPLQCSCKSSKIWLDIVIVVEVSDSMTSNGLHQAKGLLIPLIEALPVSQDIQMTSRVGIVYFSKTAIVRAELNVYKTNSEARNGINSIPYIGDFGVDLEGALQVAAGVLSNGSRSYTKSMIIFLTSSNQNSQFLDPKPIADQLKSQGITIVTIAFAQTDASHPPDVTFASPGYNFTNKDHNLDAKMLGAFCETNCFCPANWFQFGDNLVKKYGECVYPGDFPTTWTAAQFACLSTQNAFLADELNGNKQSFLKDLATRFFASANPFGYWVGLTYTNGHSTWDRNDISNSNTILSGDYTNWEPGYGLPSGSGNCTAEMTSLSFSTKWYPKDCSSPFTATFNYFCQISACDTDTWCY